MQSFVLFMASPAGRLLRIVGGAALIAWGILGLTGTNGYIVAALGVPLALTGLLNICLIAPAFGCPLRGSKTG